MQAPSTEIYQFKITLKGSKPKIWRRIQVPSNYSFWDLHVAIQDAMGWLDCHLHQFEIFDPQTNENIIISLIDDENGNYVICETKAKIAEHFLSPHQKANYEYDFGDCWEHEILFEKIVQTVIDSDYPKCIAGKRACPPEDCGGIGGYEEMLKIIKNPNHPQYEEQMEWLGGSFKPEIFHPELVRFNSSKERLKMIL